MYEHSGFSFVSIYYISCADMKTIVHEKKIKAFYEDNNFNNSPDIQSRTVY